MKKNYLIQMLKKKLDILNKLKKNLLNIILFLMINHYFKMMHLLLENLRLITFKKLIEIIIHYNYIYL